MSRHIFLSPHPDDAVWSSGGRLAGFVDRGHSVLVVTIFDGDAEEPARRLDSWRIIAHPRFRRREDLAALKSLRVEKMSLGLTDAALRSDESDWLYSNVDSLFGAVSPKDGDLIHMIREKLMEVLKCGDHLHVPLALGGHVDHRIVSEAAVGISRLVTFYEDFPYAENYCVRGFVPEVVAVDLGPWLKAALMYQSQVRALFGTSARFKLALTNWARKRRPGMLSDYGERVWSLSAPK